MGRVSTLLGRVSTLLGRVTCLVVFFSFYFRWLTECTYVDIVVVTLQMLCNGDTDDVVLFAVDWRLVTVRFESLYLNKADKGTACCYDNCYFCWVLNSLNLTVDGVDAPLLVYCYL